MLVLLIENDECPSSVALSIFFGLPRFVQSASIFGVWKHWGANCFLQHHQSSAKKKTSTWNSVCLIPITQHWRNYKLLTCHITSHQNKNPFPCLFFFLPQMGLWFMLLVRFEHLIATPHTFKLVSNRPTCFFLTLHVDQQFSLGNHLALSQLKVLVVSYKYTLFQCHRTVNKKVGYRQILSTCSVTSVIMCARHLPVSLFWVWKAPPTACFALPNHFK